MSADYHFSSCLWWGPRYASVSLYPEGPLFPVVPCNQPHYQAAGPTMALPFKWYPYRWQIFNILNWKHVVPSMVKPKWIFQLCPKGFCSGLHMTLEWRDTKLWPLTKCMPEPILALPFEWYPCGWQMFNILNWKHMVASMVEHKWILSSCWKCFYSGLHMTLECRDTKLWPLTECIPIVSTLKGRANKSPKSCSVAHEPRAAGQV